MDKKWTNAKYYKSVTCKNTTPQNGQKRARKGKNEQIIFKGKTYTNLMGRSIYFIEDFL